MLGDVVRDVLKTSVAVSIYYYAANNSVASALAGFIDDFNAQNVESSNCIKLVEEFICADDLFKCQQ